MSKLTSLFHKRTGIPENEKITFEKLNKVLEKTATSIPFENRAIIDNNKREVTKENLTDKILGKNQGGLCYELNPLLYYYLLENDFNAALVTGVVFNQAKGEYTTVGRTHVAILLDYEGERYLIDTGFGANLPLKPVPLSGETVSSRNGEFRIRKADIEQGDYVLEMKLKHKDSDWRTGYAFDSRKPMKDFANLNEIQTIIAEHPESSFNKHPLITRLTENGNITLTDSTFTQWKDGIVTKENIDHGRFKELAKQHFGM